MTTKNSVEILQLILQCNIVSSPFSVQFRQQQYPRRSLRLNQSCQVYNWKYAPKNQLFILLALCSTISIPPDAQLRRPSGGVWGDLAKIRLTSSLSFLFGPPLWRVLGFLIIALNKFCGWLDIAQDACNCNLLFMSRIISLREKQTLQLDNCL